MAGWRLVGGTANQFFPVQDWEVRQLVGWLVVFWFFLFDVLFRWFDAQKPPTSQPANQLPESIALQLICWLAAQPTS